jgi:cytochrome P450
MLSHGTTSDNPAPQMTYGLWELARRPEIQEKLREEVTATYNAIRARGKEDFTPGDIDGMAYTNAVVKVSRLNSTRPSSKRPSSNGNIGSSTMSRRRH